MVKLVYTHALGACAARRGGSSPLMGTTCRKGLNMSKEEVIAEHQCLRDESSISVKVIALTDKNTQHLDGIPVDGVSLQLGIDYSIQGLNNTAVRLFISEEDLFGLASALAGAGYKLREARAKITRGKKSPKAETFELRTTHKQ